MKGNGAARAGADGGLVLLVALLGWIEARRGAPLAMDLEVQAWMKSHRAPFLDAPAKALDLLGKPAVIAACGMAAAVLALLLGDRALGILAGANTAGLILWIEALKVGVARTRPEASGWLVHVSGGGFPSGHAAGATGLCLLLLALAGRHFKPGAARGALKAALLLLPLAMAFSRLHAGVHYASDIAGGMLLGLTWFSVCSLWWGAPPDGEA